MTYGYNLRILRSNADNSTRDLMRTTLPVGMLVFAYNYITKHLKKSNAACFYTPIVLKLLIIVQM